MTALLLAIAIAGYWLAAQNLPADNVVLAEGLRNLFIAGVAVTVAIGLMLPGRVARSADEISDAALRLADGTLTEITKTIQALAEGNVDAAGASLDLKTLPAGHDELGRLAACFNHLQSEIARVVVGLDGAREDLRQRRANAEQTRSTLRQRLRELTPAMEAANRYLNQDSTQTRPATPTATKAPSRQRPIAPPAPAAPFSNTAVRKA
jgi:methyl-accepting chemotaxis protein